MSVSRVTDSRKGRPMRFANKTVARLWKEGKCRECSVTVPRMDFAKIMGKFTKVKIQYATSPKEKPEKTSLPPPTTARLRSNENGMVLIHRSAYSSHPAKDLLTSKKKNNSINKASSNSFKESNRLKKISAPKEKSSNFNRSKTKGIKRYGIVFVQPNGHNTEENNKASLVELLPHLNNNILPSNDWIIDFLTEDAEEPEKDHIYDRIAAELEDLMYNDKITCEASKTEATHSKDDEFPSIMDILNDNLPQTKKDTTILNPEEVTHENVNGTSVVSDLCDVQAILAESPSVDADKPTIELMDTNQNQEADKLPISENIDGSSIVDEALKKAIAEQIPDETTLAAALSNDQVETMQTSDQPEVTQTSEQPEVTQTSEQPEVTQTSDQPEITQTSDQPEITQTSDQPEVTQTSNQPEVTQTSDQPEVAQTSDQPEEAQSSDQPEVAQTSDHTEVTQTSDQPKVTQTSDQLEVTQTSDQPEVTQTSEQPGVTETSDLPEVTHTSDQTEVIQNLLETGPVTDTTPQEDCPITKPAETMDVDQPSTESVVGENKDKKEKKIKLVLFKRIRNDACSHLVKCYNNLHYNIEIDGKPVDFIGAPKYITSIEDAQVLLQIVNDSDLTSFNVQH